MKKIQPTWMVVVGINNKKDDIYMTSKKNEEDALNYIKHMTSDETLEGLFTVNNFGEVIHYRVVWDGRLKIVNKFPSLPSEDVF